MFGFSQVKLRLCHASSALPCCMPLLPSTSSSLMLILNLAQQIICQCLVIYHKPLIMGISQNPEQLP